MKCFVCSKEQDNLICKDCRPYVKNNSSKFDVKPETVKDRY